MKCETCEGTGRISQGGKWVICPDCSAPNESGQMVGTGVKLVGGDDKGDKGKKPKSTDNPPPVKGGGVGN